MVALLNSRAPGLGERILARIDREASGRHARGLIRAAGQAWLKAAETEPPPAAAVVPAAVVPAPVVPAPVVPVEVPADESFVIDPPAPESPPQVNVTKEAEVAPPVRPSPPVYVEEPPPEPPAPAAPNPDRVDELLRQFRERYGRGGP
jgi:hypothetical protein